MTALMRMHIVSQNNPNLPHYQHIVSQLSKRWNIPLVWMRHWISKYVSGFCGWLEESVYLTLSLLWDEVTGVHCFCLQSQCCAVVPDFKYDAFLFFFIYLIVLWSGWSDSLLWLSAVFEIMLCKPLRFLQPKNILSRQDMSESIAMETVLKSLERRPPLWLHPIRF